MSRLQNAEPEIGPPSPSVACGALADERGIASKPWSVIINGLWARAAGLDIRLAHPAPGTPESDDAVTARWEAWREEAAAGSDELMVRRLLWDGLSEVEARGRLGGDGLKGPAPHDPWIQFLQRLPAVGGEIPDSGGVRAVIEKAEGVPFAAAYAPFLAAAVRGVEPGLKPIAQRVDDAVLAGMVDGLLRELARLGGRVLAAAFTEHLRERGVPEDASQSQAHNAFVMRLGTCGGWGPILDAYPVLGRLMAVACIGWMEDGARFFARLHADWELLPTVFFPTLAEGSALRLHRLDGTQTDRHGGVCAVRVLEFSSGDRLVYKARTLELEADYHDLLRTLAAEGMPDCPPALRVLARPGYGWVEYADATPVPDREALEAWYRTAGSLLCLIHLLGGNDGHMENIVATSQGPVFIDVETLLQPRRSGNAQASSGTFEQAARQVHDSVLQSGLLPLWQQGRNGRPYDIGGFTGAGGYESPVLHQTWEHVGTNAIRPAWRRAVTRGMRNLPVLDGVRHSAGSHLPALTTGFSRAWQFLQTRRELLGEVLPRWAAAPIRVLVRPTTQYAALLERGLSVTALKSGLDRSILFEALRRPMVRHHTTKPAYWPAVAEEIRSLEDGDIPIFYVQAGGRDLESADGRCLVPEAFAESAVASVAARLERLTDRNRRRQLELIAAAFIESDSAPAPLPPLESTTASVDIDALLAAAPLVSDAGLVATAEILGQQVLNAAIRGRDGFVTWVAPSCLHPGQSSHQGVSHYLYDGAAGIALFLAALARVTGNEAARTTALAALMPVRSVLESPNARDMIRREGVGGCSGLGSLVYTLTVIAGLLDAPELLERARRVSHHIDNDRIAADNALDIVSGSAGAIRALLALHRAGGGADALQRASTCGRHLLSRAERVGADAIAWPSWPDRLLLAGYSHGTAGHASALAALFEATGDQAFGEAARAALRHERGMFDAAAGNWPVLLPAGDSRLATAWCHGAPGVLLSRAGMLGILGEDEDRRLREEMVVAERTTVGAGLSSLDHLCCGTMGRVEILDTVAAALGGRAREVARLGASATIRRAQQRRAFSLQPDPVRNAVFQPGFFRGLSGLGYSFLRMARPDLLPAVLAWETSPSPTP